MKKAIIVASVFRPEPVVSAGLLEDLALELSKEYDVTVLRPKPSRPLGFELKIDNDEVTSYKVVTLESFVCPESKPIGRFRESVSHGLAAARYIRRNKDNIDFIYNDSWHLFGLYIVARCAVKCNIPYISPVQDVYPEAFVDKIHSSFIRKLFFRILRPIDKYSLTHASVVQTISPALVEYLSETRHIPKDNFVLVRNWQDERRFIDFKKRGIINKNEKFTFMFLGSVGFLSGLDNVILAFKEANILNSRLIIAGNGTARKELEKLASTSNGCDIVFCDAPFEKVPELQSKADVLLLPLKVGVGKTSVPSKLPAYMLSSKPVIASVDLYSDTARCVNAAKAGWVIPPEDVRLMAQTMKEAVLTDKSEIDRMGENAFEFAIKNFSKSHNLKLLADKCRCVIEGSN